MTNRVMLRTVRVDGSHVSESCKVVSTKHNRAVLRSHAGGGSVFRRTNSVYARIERAIDGNCRWGDR